MRKKITHILENCGDKLKISKTNKGWKTDICGFSNWSPTKQYHQRRLRKMEKKLGCKRVHIILVLFRYRVVHANREAAISEPVLSKSISKIQAINRDELQQATWKKKELTTVWLSSENNYTV